MKVVKVTLEADRVWIINFDGMPHPMAKRDWQIQHRRVVAQQAPSGDGGEVRGERRQGTPTCCES